MLTSITPLGERGRGQRWAITAAFLVVGHGVGGAALGAVAAGVGSTIRALGVDVSSDVSLAVVVGSVVVAAVVDVVVGAQLGRRQVDERWLTTYRGWVYGFGFGVQLGFGLVTVVNTALLVPFVVAMVASPPLTALLLGLGYGLVRGLAAIGGGWVREVEQLRRLHRWVDLSDHTVRSVGTAVSAATALGALGMVMVG